MAAHGSLAAPSGLLGRLRRRFTLRRARARRWAFCAIATRDFMPWALALFDSLQRHHPGAARVLLYVRRSDEAGTRPVVPGATVVGVRDLVDAAGEAALRRRFTVAELCFSLKPRLLRYALDHLGDRAIYLDTDIDVLAPLDEAAIALEGADVVLTPHLDAPLPMDGKLPSDVTILRAGACNLGFIGVAAAPGARSVLEWWDARVQRWGFVAPEAGYQGDQKWMDLAPSLFSGVALLRDPGSNVGYWNLHSRTVTPAPSGPHANGRRIAFFHFSGLDPDRPEVLSRFDNRLDTSGLPVVMGLARDFARRMVEARSRAAQLAWTSAPAAAPPQPGATPSPPSLPDEAYRAKFAFTPPHGSVETGAEAEVAITVTNDSPVPWAVGRDAEGRGGIALSWHIRDEAGAMVAWDNARHFLERDLAPGESLDMVVGMRMPARPGLYRADLDLVHEGRAWFSEKGGPTAEVGILVGRF